MPDPAIFLLAFERLGARPKDCLYIGDGGDHELRGAISVGMHAVLVAPPGASATALGGQREI